MSDVIYHSEKLRSTKSGRVRFRLQSRLFREPLIVLQLEETYEEKRKTAPGYGFVNSWAPLKPEWRDVTLEDLTVTSISHLIKPREGGELPTCFKPQRNWWKGWMLVLQVLDGSHKAGSWRNARLQDLRVKDGKLLDGLGLIA